MFTTAPNYLSRYYILFFENFIKTVPNIPEPHLSKWHSFKEMIKHVPIPIESIHNYLAEMLHCEPNHTIEQLESLTFSDSNNNFAKPTIEQIPVFAKFDHEKSPRMKMKSPGKIKENSPEKTKNAYNRPFPFESKDIETTPKNPKKQGDVIVKNFRSNTQDFSSKSKGFNFNPFMPVIPRNIVTTHKKSDDDFLDNASPLIRKLTNNEITFEHAKNESKFKSYAQVI